MSPRPRPLRYAWLILGDQLDPDSPALRELDPERDEAWMLEVDGEATHVASHRARIALFLSAMRHFALRLRATGIPLRYRELAPEPDGSRFATELERWLRERRPEALRVVEPGEHRVLEEIRQACLAAGPNGGPVRLEILPDRSFYCSREEFDRHAAGRRQLRMEFFYREMRKRHGVLMDGAKPAGGAWNFDRANRESFGAEAPGPDETLRFEPDAITREVLDLVGRRFPAHPGSLEAFDWPVTPEQAEAALRYFVERHLPSFGRYQDAMWSGRAYLHHSRLSAAMNLKLLSPRRAVEAAEQAYREGRAPLASVEGFIRQILGWREYVRGVYWHHMPEYLARNALGARAPLPGFFWTGDTELRCLHHVIRQTLDLGYAHHIQRLMVTGLFCLLLGVDPVEVHRWYLAVYVDAVEWVELPNTLGMSQYADGGVMASKPYIASGKYVDRMSDYCRGCRFDPNEATGPRACPMTTLYWDFVRRHQKLLAGNPRLGAQAANWRRMPPKRQEAIAELAERWRARFR